MSTMGRSFWVLDNVTTLHQSEFETLANSPVLFKPSDTFLYRFPKVRMGNEALPKYPRPSVIIDYYIPEKQTIKLDIFNERDELVNSFVSDSIDADKENEFFADMATNTVTYTVNKKLKSGKGAHRFEWNMTHFGPWDKNKSRRYANGPMVSPGVYKVRLTAGEKVIEKEFNLLADPRLKEEGTTGLRKKVQHLLYQSFLFFNISKCCTFFL